MPFTRKKQKYKRRPRKQYGKRKRYDRKEVSLFNQTPGFPLGQKFLYKTRYFENNISFNPPTAGLAINYIYSANGLYDPNISGVGHQPMGFDQLMAMFDHYTVIASKIRVTFTNTDTGNSVLCGVRLNDDASPSIDPAQIVENGNGVYATLQPSGNGSGSQKTLTCSFTPKKYLGVSHPMSEKDLQGNGSSNPAEQAYFCLWAADNSGGGDPAALEVNVTISYVAILTEPRELGTS